MGILIAAYFVSAFRQELSATLSVRWQFTFSGHSPPNLLFGRLRLRVLRPSGV
jgi:hypothetical protein